MAASRFLANRQSDAALPNVLGGVNSARRRMLRRSRPIAERLFCLAVLCLTAQTYGQSAGPVFPDPGHPSMSRENQEALGMEAAAQVYEQMPVVPDKSPETQYVRQIGQKLVATIRHSTHSHLSFISFPKTGSTHSLCRGSDVHQHRHDYGGRQ